MVQLRKITQGPKQAPLKNNLVSVNERIRCDLCSGFVRETDQQMIKYKAHTYHLKCFRCAKCRRSMQNLKVYSDDEAHKLFCETCYLASLNHCAACKKPIQDQMVTLGPKLKLHQSCFTCSVCKEPLESYIEQDEKCFCQPCYLATCLPCCVACSKPLRVHHDGQTLEQLSYRGKNFHPECFLCDQCQGSLDQPMENGSNGTANPSDQQPTVTTSNVRGPAAEQSRATQVVSKMYFSMGGQKLCQHCAYSSASSAGKRDSTAGKRDSTAGKRDSTAGKRDSTA